MLLSIFVQFVGIHEPLIISKPGNNLSGNATKTQRRKNDALTTLLDILPTVLDWHNIEIPAGLTGKSLLPLLGKDMSMLILCSRNNLKKPELEIVIFDIDSNTISYKTSHSQSCIFSGNDDNTTPNNVLQQPEQDERDLIFGSHSFHEVTMTYPMRYARSALWSGSMFCTKNQICVAFSS